MKIPIYALPHRVTVIPFKGNGAYGPIWDGTKAKKEVPCLIEPKTTVIKDATGTDVTVRADVMFHPDYTIRENDKIQWPMTGAEYTVTELTPVMAMGLSHWEGVLT